MKQYIPILLLVSAPVWAAHLEGRVVRVHDGDSIHILSGRQRVKVRLHGIDAPERRQPHGLQARNALAAMIAGKVVQIQVSGKDRYGRTIGTVVAMERFQKPDEHSTTGTRIININKEMVRQGWAWCYRKYARRNPELYRQLMRLEQEAKTARRGVWADLQPVPPWEWRRLQRSGRKR